MVEIETRIGHIWEVFFALQIVARPLAEYRSAMNNMVGNYDLIPPSAYEQPEMDGKLLMLEQQVLELEEDLRRTMRDVLNSPDPSRYKWTEEILALRKELRSLRRDIRSALGNQKTSYSWTLPEEHKKEVGKYLSRRLISAPDLKKLDQEDHTDLLEHLSKSRSHNTTINFKDFTKIIRDYKDKVSIYKKKLRNTSEENEYVDSDEDEDGQSPQENEYVDCGEDEDGKSQQENEYVDSDEDEDGQSPQENEYVDCGEDEDGKSQQDTEDSRPDVQERSINGDLVGSTSQVARMRERFTSTTNRLQVNEVLRPAIQQCPINDDLAGSTSQVSRMRERFTSMTNRQQVARMRERFTSTTNRLQVNEVLRPAIQQCPINDDLAGSTSQVSRMRERFTSMINRQQDTEDFRPDVQQRSINGDLVGSTSQQNLRTSSNSEGSAESAPNGSSSQA
ncbi:uncharacterized protein LOC119784487 [Cyprinodon tularosa]|uniref:uncharacterized protein LOC119784487 n=1 Tax=Cyprinodon tularosa TaxID=77115 RepID=UPI0018E219A5|nr:uncharacterized protein LOC119784487 [Cyprinodon tularosa]